MKNLDYNILITDEECTIKKVSKSIALVRAIIPLQIFQIYAVLNKYIPETKTNICVVTTKQDELLFTPRVTGINHGRRAIHAEELALQYIRRHNLSVVNIILYAVVRVSKSTVVISNGNPCSRCRQLLINAQIINNFIGINKEDSSRTPLITRGNYMIDDQKYIFRDSFSKTPVTTKSTISYNSGRSRGNSWSHPAR